jgi:hypothetical protein
LNANIAMKIGRRKAGSWGNPTRKYRTAANRGTRAALKRELRGQQLSR